MKIEIVDYDDNWSESFKELKHKIWPLVSEYSLSMEHVGSTSVKGLSAKPIIDIDIIIKNTTNFEVIINILEKLGYEFMGDLGIEGRYAFKCIKPVVRHNLYVCLMNCTALINHLTLRDHLRINANDRKLYSNLKKELSHKFQNDIDGYVDGKTDFILSILKKNEMNNDALKSIERSNKIN